jgi:hypothetical protein
LVTADDPDDGLACLRVRSGRCELMVATGKTEKKEKKRKKNLQDTLDSSLLIHG